MKPVTYHGNLHYPFKKALQELEIELYERWKMFENLYQKKNS